MTGWLAVYVALVKAVLFCTGLIILFYTVRAARQSGDNGLWALALGIALSGIALVFSGVLSSLLGAPAVVETALTSTVAALGLAVIVYSLTTQAQLRVDQS